eukprot:gene7698-biopygen2854
MTSMPRRSAPVSPDPVMPHCLATCGGGGLRMGHRRRPRPLRNRRADAAVRVGHPAGPRVVVRRPEELEDLLQLVRVRPPREQRLPRHHLREDAAPTSAIGLAPSVGRALLYSIVIGKRGGHRSQRPAAPVRSRSWETPPPMRSRRSPHRRRGGH